MSVHSDVLSAHPKDDDARLRLVEEVKSRGNAEFGNRRYDCADALYTKAIEVAPKSYAKHSLYGNRSATKLAMNKGEEALKDAEAAIDADPNWAKGYVRKALALQRLKKFDESLAALKQAQKLEPSSKYVQKTIKKVMKAKATEADLKRMEAERKAKEPKSVKPPPPENFGKAPPKPPATKSETSATKTGAKNNSMRGYKVLADGTKTSYFHTEISDEAKRLIGDIRPKKLDSTAKNVVEAPKPATGASVWNQKGTFEERDRSAWSKKHLTARLKTVSVNITDCERAFTIAVTDVTDFGGDASIAITAKRKSCLFDFKFVVHWSASSEDDTTAFSKGKLKYRDVCHDELDDLDPDAESVRAAKAGDSRAARVRMHVRRTSGLLQKAIVKALKEFQIEFNKQ